MKSFIDIIHGFLLESDTRDSEIEAYNAELRQRPSGPVSIARNPLFNSSIPYQRNNLYRIIGASGLADFMQCGKLRANPDGKGGFAHAYYEVGKANNIYAKGGNGDVVAEVQPEAGRFEKNSDEGYPRTRPGDEITKNDKVRIWQKNPTTGKHEIIFDNIHDSLSNRG